MPRLVDEMAVARNRIDLASDGFEIFIFFSEILKLRGAHERKVRRIEEKHGPLPEDIGLGHGLEGVVLKSLNAEFAYFLIDQDITISFGFRWCVRTAMPPRFVN